MNVHRDPTIDGRRDALDSRIKKLQRLVSATGPPDWAVLEQQRLDVTQSSELSSSEPTGAKEERGNVPPSADSEADVQYPAALLQKALIQRIRGSEELKHRINPLERDNAAVVTSQPASRKRRADDRVNDNDARALEKLSRKQLELILADKTAQITGLLELTSDLRLHMAALLKASATQPAGTGLQMWSSEPSPPLRGRGPPPQIEHGSEMSAMLPPAVPQYSSSAALAEQSAAALIAPVGRDLRQLRDRLAEQTTRAETLSGLLENERWLVGDLTVDRTRLTAQLTDMRARCAAVMNNKRGLEADKTMMAKAAVDYATRIAALEAELQTAFETRSVQPVDTAEVGTQTSSLCPAPRSPSSTTPTAKRMDSGTSGPEQDLHGLLHLAPVTAGGLNPGSGTMAAVRVPDRSRGLRVELSKMRSELIASRASVEQWSLEPVPLGFPELSNLLDQSELNLALGLSSTDGSETATPPLINNDTAQSPTAGRGNNEALLDGGQDVEHERINPRKQEPTKSPDWDDLLKSTSELTLVDPEIQCPSDITGVPKLLVGSDPERTLQHATYNSMLDQTRNGAAHSPTSGCAKISSSPAPRLFATDHGERVYDARLADNELGSSSSHNCLSAGPSVPGCGMTRDEGTATIPELERALADEKAKSRKANRKARKKARQLKFVRVQLAYAVYDLRELREIAGHLEAAVLPLQQSLDDTRKLYEASQIELATFLRDGPNNAGTPQSTQRLRGTRLYRSLDDR